MKTADELQLSQEEFDALLKVRDLLFSGSVRHLEDPVFGSAGFNMDSSCSLDECGSVMCIGGWMKTFILGVQKGSDGTYDISSHQQKIRDYVHNFRPDWSGLGDFGGYKRNHPIAKLFFPPDGNVDYEDITPEQALMAIENFLATGDPKWAEVTADADDLDD